MGLGMADEDGYAVQEALSKGAGLRHPACSILFLCLVLRGPCWTGPRGWCRLLPCTVPLTTLARIWPPPPGATHLMMPVVGRGICEHHRRISLLRCELHGRGG